MVIVLNKCTMRKITTAEELHGILLDLGKEFHRVCTRYNIPYYMLGGTMLGAIRHKGFIPWDDDMDFGVPREHYERLKDVLNKELPSYYKVLTLDNSKALFTDIIKISDERTEIKEKFKDNVKESLGINIDIFPLDKSSGNSKKAKAITVLLKLSAYRFLSLTPKKSYKKALAVLLKILFCRMNKRMVINIIDKHLIEYEGDYIANVYGAWGIKETVQKNVMGIPVLYRFEDTYFYGVADYHAYLSSLYKNYMQLPSPEKRHIHIVNSSWK